jgi:hypothetical protein
MDRSNDVSNQKVSIVADFEFTPLEVSALYQVFKSTLGNCVHSRYIFMSVALGDYTTTKSNDLELRWYQSSISDKLAAFDSLSKMGMLYIATEKIQFVHISETKVGRNAMQKMFSHLETKSEESETMPEVQDTDDTSETVSSDVSSV